MTANSHDLSQSADDLFGEVADPYGDAAPGYAEAVKEALREIRTRGYDVPPTADYANEGRFAVLRDLPTKVKVITAMGVVASGLVLWEMPAIGRAVHRGAAEVSSVIGHGVPGDTSEQAKPIIDDETIALGIREGLIAEEPPVDIQAANAGDVFYDNGVLMMLVVHRDFGDDSLREVPYDQWTGHQQSALKHKILKR